MKNQHYSFIAVKKVQGFCSRYDGRVCRKHLGSLGLVWYNISSSNMGGWLNEKITSEIWTEMINNFREPCRTTAEVNIYVIVFFSRFLLRNIIFRNSYVDLLFLNAILLKDLINKVFLFAKKTAFLSSIFSVSMNGCL